MRADPAGSGSKLKELSHEIFDPFFISSKNYVGGPNKPPK